MAPRAPTSRAKRIPRAAEVSTTNPPRRARLAHAFEAASSPTSLAAQSVRFSAGSRPALSLVSSFARRTTSPVFRLLPSPLQGLQVTGAPVTATPSPVPSPRPIEPLKKSDFPRQLPKAVFYDAVLRAILAPPAKNVVNDNGKRPAEDSELGGHPEVQRVIPALHEQPRGPMLSFAQRLQTQLATMGAAVFRFFGGRDNQLPSPAHEADDTRRANSDDSSVVVKRFKRQACIPPGEPPPVLLAELPYLSWTDDITRHVGRNLLTPLFDHFVDQIKAIGDDQLAGGVSVDAIKEYVAAHDDQALDLDLSIAVHRLMCDQVGAITKDDPVEIQFQHFETAKELYLEGLVDVCSFMASVYNPVNFAAICQEFPTPQIPFCVGDYHFRNATRHGAEFLAWFLRLEGCYETNEAQRTAIGKIIVDANAIHKQELPPSFVAHPGAEHHPAIPGSFPISVFDEISTDNITIDPVYALKHPETEAFAQRLPFMETPKKKEQEPTKMVTGLAKKTEYKIVGQPKGILKLQGKDWPEEPASPSYVPTPEKRRKLGFINPVAKDSPPKNIPAKVGIVVPKVEKVVSTNTAKQTQVIQEPEGNDEPEEPGSPNHHHYDPKKFPLLNPRPRLNLIHPVIRDLSVKDIPPNFTLNSSPHIQIYSAQEKARAQIQQSSTAEDRRKAIAKFFELHDDEDEVEKETTAPAEPKPASPTEFLTPTGPVTPGTHIEATPPRPVTSGTPTEAVVPAAPNAAQAVHPTISTVPATPTRSLPHRGLEVSALVHEEFAVKHQVQAEWIEGLVRAAKEREQRRIEEERRRVEEEQRRIEEECRRKEEEERLRREAEERAQEELRQREADNRRAAAEARRLKEAAQYAALTGLRAPARRIVTPMTAHWDERVTRAERANPNTDLTTTLDGNPLRRDDFSQKLLPERAWLNDNVIIGSILYVAQFVNDAAGVNGKQNPKCSALTSYFWPRLQQHGLTSCARLMRLAGIRKENFLDIDTILIPICEGNHWTLGVVCPRRRTVSHVDSMQSGKGNPAVARRLTDWVEATLQEKYVAADWKTIEYAAPRQTNGYDCGVFTITNAICLALGVDMRQAYHADELTCQRRLLAAMLLNGGFKGDFSLAGL